MFRYSRRKTCRIDLSRFTYRASMFGAVQPKLRRGELVAQCDGGSVQQHLTDTQNSYMYEQGI